MTKNFDVIGLMSGTSLDGLDIAHCQFTLNNSAWTFQLLETETVSYTQVWLELLKEAPLLDGVSLALLHTSYGHWIGQTVDQFIKKYNIHPRLIASHGQTIFHRPADKMTLQIGSGAAIAAETGITTVCDFRSLNIALGGQGAPLVPIGDMLLFSEFDACVNIGGFANISLTSKKKRIAWDICPANIVLNHLSAQLGLPFDASGNIAKNGKTDNKLLAGLSSLSYYKQHPPKSLGKEWVEQYIFPLLEGSSLPVEDLISTFTAHVAHEIAKNIPSTKGSKVIFTGGGTHNTHLMRLITEQSQSEIVIPDNRVINFKEALIFAFLGVLRIENMVNCLASATGASADCSGGVVHYPPSRQKKLNQQEK